MDCSVNSLTRDAKNPGLWLGMVVPVLLSFPGTHILGLDLACSVFLLLLLLLNNKYTILVLFGAYIPILASYFLNTTFSVRSLFVFGFILCCTRGLLRAYPKSFTIGEALLMSHLLAVFVHSSPLFLSAFLTAYLVERYALLCTWKTVAAIVLINLSGMLFLLKKLFPKSYALYSLKLRSVICFFTFYDFLLLFIWVILLFFCVGIICIRRYLHPERLPSLIANRELPKSDEAASLLESELYCELQASVNTYDLSSAAAHPQLECSRKRVFPEESYHLFWLRKVFHICAGLVFILGLLFSPQLLSLCSACLFVAFGILEWLRRRGPERYSLILNNLVGPFRDQRDSGDLVFTPVALLLGLSIPLWWSPVTLRTQRSINLSHLCSEWEPPPSAWSGVLSIAIGDTLAALVGRGCGRLRWPGSHRTLEGSTASCLGQILFWLPLARHYGWPWRAGIIPIATGVLAEAYTEQIDNLVVPLLVMATFMHQSPG